MGRVKPGEKGVLAAATSDPALQPRLQDIAKCSNRFALSCRDLSSPLYEHLSLGIARDPRLLELAGQARKGQPQPNLLFAVVHLLLLKGARHPLTAYYPSVSSETEWHKDPYPYFQSFCHQHRDQIVDLITHRLVQTNVVGRCAYLLPAFSYVARRGGGLPLSLVEIGASAGLNLLWDRYGYSYGEDGRFGHPQSPVQIHGELRGAHRPPLSPPLSPVAFRVGMDLNPIDLHNPEEVLWLRALVWPERRDEDALLMAAIQVAKQDPPTLIAGDAVRRLPRILRSVLEGTALCIYGTHTLNQFSPKAREELASLIEKCARRRNLYWVSVEEFTSPPQMQLVAFENGKRTEALLARCDTHGRWLEWLASS